MTGLFLDAFVLNELPKEHPVHVGMDSIVHLLSGMAAIPLDDRFGSTLPVWNFISPKVGYWVHHLSAVQEEEAHVPLQKGFFSFVRTLYANLVTFIGWGPFEGEAEIVPELRR